MGCKVVDIKNIDENVKNELVMDDVYDYLSSVKPGDKVKVTDMINHIYSLHESRLHSAVSETNLLDEISDCLKDVIEANAITTNNALVDVLLFMSSNENSAAKNMIANSVVGAIKTKDQKSGETNKDRELLTNTILKHKETECSDLIRSLLTATEFTVKKNVFEEFRAKQEIESRPIETVSYKYVGNKKRIMYVHPKVSLPALQQYLKKNNCSNKLDYVGKYVENPEELVNEQYVYQNVYLLKYALMMRRQEINTEMPGYLVYFPTRPIVAKPKTRAEEQDKRKFMNLLAHGNCDKDALLSARYCGKTDFAIGKKKLKENFAEYKNQQVKDIDVVLKDVFNDETIQSLVAAINARRSKGIK